MNWFEAIWQHPTTLALGWSLIHFLWQGALIALLLALADLVLRKARAAARYAAACAAMLLMLVASVTTLVLLLAAPASPVAADIRPAHAPVFRTMTQAFGSSQAVFYPQAWLARCLPWAVAIWFAGVLVLSVRSFGGWLVAQRLRWNGNSQVDSMWFERLELLKRKLRVSRAVSLCESAIAKVPSVIGWLRPVILLPASTLAGLSPEMLEALLAHELAHIRRHDYLVNILQTVVETLLFYHPAVWWVGKRIRDERENCCDDLAVAACGNVLTYARALTSLEHLRGPSAQLALASTGGSLLVRIRRLAGVRPPSDRLYARPLAGILATIAMFGAWAIGQTTLASRHQALGSVTDSARAGFIEMAQAPTATGTGSAQAAGRSQASTPAGQAETESAAQTHNDFIGGLAAAGYKGLSVDDLIQFKIHGVTPEFIRQMQAAGLSHPDPDDLVSMRIHDVTPAFIQELKDAGFSGLSVDDLVSFKIHGVTPARIKELRALWGKMDADEVVSAQIHQVTPEYAQQIKSMGLGDPTFDDVVSMKIHDVTPEYAKDIKALGLKGLDLDQITAFKIHGVTPEKVRELQGLGFNSLSADDAVSMQIHGVTPEFVRGLKDAGIANLTADDAVAARIHGVTPEFVRAARKHGFNNLSLDQLMELKRFNILPDTI